MNRSVFSIAAAFVAATIVWGTPHLNAHAATADMQSRIDAATADAARRGAGVQIAYLDRAEGYWAGNAAARVAEPTASVSKVFIADNLLLRAGRGQLALSPADRGAMTSMLRSSNDDAAQSFWDRFGGASMVADVVGRYHLGNASVQPRWFDTRISSADMVSYYNQVIAGQGGLAPADRDFILGQLRAITPFGVDGYNQQFGLPQGLPNEPARAVKQGWMIAENNDWIHNSTGVLGPENRYIVAVFSQEPAGLGDPHARDTVNRVVNIMFPRGTAEQSPLDDAVDQVRHAIGQ
jgi:hypothetical protein